MRFVIAAILGVHGIAHFVGFVSSWQLATLAELPYKTTILAGRFDIGDAGIRAVGLLWLLAGLGFLLTAIVLAAQIPWAPRLATFMIAASLVLCVIGLPDSRIGVLVNIALAALLLSARSPVVTAVP